MEKTLPYAAVSIVLLYALYNAAFKVQTPEKNAAAPTYRAHVTEHKTEHAREELARLQSTEYLRQYIVSVIDHGSYQFDFPGGEMEGGFASPADAEKIACYVMTLSGKACGKPYKEDAAMFYSSNCAGCHGDDGKGLNGTYPDLTRKKLLGIESREAFLKQMLKKRP